MSKEQVIAVKKRLQEREMNKVMSILVSKGIDEESAKKASEEIVGAIFCIVVGCGPARTIDLFTASDVLDSLDCP
jgi:pantothenate kinase type III